MNVRVYGPGPSCQRCNGTKRDLKNHDIAFTDVNTTEDPVAAKYAADLGHTTAPVVVVLNEFAEVIDHWSGHRPDRIRELARSLAA